MTYVIGSAIIRNHETFLIVKRSLSATFAPGKWEFVSGFTKEYEALEETVLREVTEELTCTGHIVSALPLYEITDEDGRWIVVPFEVELDASAIALSSEHVEYKWATKREISKLSDLTTDLIQMRL